MSRACVTGHANLREMYWNVFRKKNLMFYAGLKVMIRAFEGHTVFESYTVLAKVLGYLPLHEF